MPLQKVVASLDIGSDKIVCLVGYVKPDHNVCIKGIGHMRSRGIKNGVVINKKELEQAIYSAVSSAEKMAGKDFKIENLSVNVNSLIVESNIIDGRVELKRGEVREEDKNNILKNIRRILESNGYSGIHLTPISYLVDGDVVEDPYIKGDFFSIKCNLLCTEKKYIKYLDDALFYLNKDIKYFSNGTANSYSVVSDFEKEEGVMIVDIGADSTDISVIYNKKYIFEKGFQIAGNLFTSDISNVLKIKKIDAELIKIKNVDFTNKNEATDCIDLEEINDENFDLGFKPKKIINDIVRYRTMDIINFIKQEIIIKRQYKNMIKTIVITGGSAEIKGIDVFFENELNIQTRIGYNDYGWDIYDSELAEQLKKPFFSVAIGMLRYVTLNPNTYDLNTPWYIKLLKKIFI